MSYEEEKQDRKIEQLEAEIERLRAKVGKMEFLMRSTDDTCLACAIKLEVIDQQAARIKELEALRSDILEAMRRPKTTSSDGLILYLKELDEYNIRTTKRVGELEDALVEERARRRHATERGSSCKYHKECEQEDLNFCDFDGCPHKIDYFMKKACQRLQAEGKIGPEDANPRSWRITEERVRAIQWASEMAGDCKAGDILRAMLGASQ